VHHDTRGTRSVCVTKLLNFLPYPRINYVSEFTIYSVYDRVSNGSETIRRSEQITVDFSFRRKCRPRQISKRRLSDSRSVRAIRKNRRFSGLREWETGKTSERNPSIDSTLTDLTKDQKTGLFSQRFSSVLRRRPYTIRRRRWRRGPRRAATTARGRYVRTYFFYFSFARNGLIVCDECVYTRINHISCGRETGGDELYIYISVWKDKRNKSAAAGTVSETVSISPRSPPARPVRVRHRSRRNFNTKINRIRNIKGDDGGV